MSASPLRAFGSRQRKNSYEGRGDTRKRRKFKEQTRELPHLPGVYFFYGHDDRLLYIGKAKRLRERVRSYFADTSLPRPPKIRRLLAEITRFETHRVGSDLEALLLERRLIAERQPLLNRQHKRFEVYPYLLLSDEEFPRLTITRAEPIEGETDKETGLILREISEGMRETRPLETPKAGDVPGLYLGPFTTPRHAYWALDAVVKLFPLRSCAEFSVSEKNVGCFYREIGRCCGPCIGQTSREQYGELCDDLVKLLETGEAPQLDELKNRMLQLADKWQFEDAAKVKEQIQALEQVATRLRRLARMRRENNAVIAQPGLIAGTTALFLVRGGAVRRHIVVARDTSHVLGAPGVQNVATARRAVRETFEPQWEARQFTAKTELDEMMIIDRWLRSHGEEQSIAWMNDLSSRNWVSNALRHVLSADLEEMK